MKTIAPQTSEWLQRAQALAPLIEKYRDEGEQQRRLSLPVFDALVEAGFFYMLIPKAFGGAQADLETFLQVLEELSYRNASVGWNVMIAGGCGMFADYLPESAAHDIFSSGKTVLAGGLAPTGRATAAPGGYRVSGRWSFASGCQHANWIFAGCQVWDAGAPRLTEDGKPDAKVLFFPADQCEILDTWHTAGMRGTGSHDLQVSDIFVPEERSYAIAAMANGSTPRSTTGYQQAFAAVGPLTIAAVALGIAQDAIEAFRELAGVKVGRGATSTLAVQHTIQQRVGRAEALLRSGRAYLYETAHALTHLWQPDSETVTELTAAARLASTFVAQNAVDSVDLMFDAGGGTSIYATSRLERCFRDVHVVTHHHMVAPSNIEMVGQYLLGLGLQTRR